MQSSFWKRLTPVGAECLQSTSQLLGVCCSTHSSSKVAVELCLMISSSLRSLLTSLHKHCIQATVCAYSSWPVTGCAVSGCSWVSTYDVWGFESPKEIPTDWLRSGLILHHLLLRRFAVMIQVAPVRNLLSCALLPYANCNGCSSFLYSLGRWRMVPSEKGFRSGCLCLALNFSFILCWWLCDYWLFFSFRRSPLSQIQCPIPRKFCC